MTLIELAIKEAGGPAAVARLRGVTVQAVCFWRDGRRPTPPELCADLEQATAGKFSCEQLLPTGQWVRMPDPAWPWHPEGRPLWDFTAVRTVAAVETQKAA